MVVSAYPFVNADIAAAAAIANSKIVGLANLGVNAFTGYPLSATDLPAGTIISTPTGGQKTVTNIYWDPVLGTVVYVHA